MVTDSNKDLKNGPNQKILKEFHLQFLYAFIELFGRQCILTYRLYNLLFQEKNLLVREITDQNLVRVISKSLLLSELFGMVLINKMTKQLS